MFPECKVTEIYFMADDFCKEFTLQQEKYMVNTQFRAYPFYKASEWMPHKKLLLNSIVF